MRAIVLGSGSKGNSTIIMDNHTKILIDIGFSYAKTKKILEFYEISPSDIDAILITHAHKDHIGGLSVFIKKHHTKVYANKVLYEELRQIILEDNLVLVEDNYFIDNFYIREFQTSHDSKGSVGFIIENNQKSLVYVTDTGYIKKDNLKKMVNKNIYIMESNHDIEMLMEGPYPYSLKQRVLSDEGHLSNEMAGTYLRDIIGIDTKKVVLAHLSETNNCEDVALKTTKSIIGDKINNIDLLVAKQDEALDLGEF